MTATTEPTPRARLVRAAAELSYRQGVGVGVEALCKAAGVSKRSMYQLFTSKDELLAAALRSRAEDYRGALMPAAGDPRPPREQVLHVFRRLEQMSAEPEYRGCPFLSAQIELKDGEHPASVVAGAVKRTLVDFFLEQAREGGAERPELLARQLMLVFDGASSRAGVGADTMDGLAVPTAAALLDAAGVR